MLPPRPQWSSTETFAPQHEKPRIIIAFFFNIPTGFPMFAINCMLAPQVVRLDYTITPHTLQYFPCLLLVSYYFRCWLKKFGSPQRHVLVPLCALSSLNLFLCSNIQEYYCEGLPLSIFRCVVVFLLRSAHFFSLDCLISTYPGHFLRIREYFNIWLERTSLNIQKSAEVSYPQIESSSPLQNQGICHMQELQPVPWHGSL